MPDSKTKARRRGEFPPLPEPLPFPAVDNHTHLDSIPTNGLDSATASLPLLAQNDDLMGAAQRQLELAAVSGIDRIVQCACEIPSIRWTDQWLRGLVPDAAAARVVAAIAIHPNETVRHARVYEVAADGLAPHDLPHHEIPLAAAIAEVAATAAKNPKIRAIGETGMDLFRAGSKGAEVQRKAFRDHIAIAKELGLALQIHDREAHADVIDVLLKDGAPERTVFHCFSGDAEMAQVCADQGWYLSFAGPVTYKANDALRAAAQIAPLELILAETDAPYLTPHPYRGQPNAPYVVNYTIRALAEIKGLPLPQMCQAISDNSEKVYGPWPQ